MVGLTIVFWASCLLPVQAADATEWASFRGPNGSGLGTGSPPVKWNIETGENVKWKTPIPGLAHSSPIVWGDRVFVTTAVSLASEPQLSTGWLHGSGDSDPESGEWEWKVLCLDRKTGRMLWEKTAHRGEPKTKRHPKSTHANSTPASDGKNVVALFGSEGLHCYDLDGQLRWKKDLGTLDAGPVGYPDMQWGFAGSPILRDGKVIVQCDVRNTSFWAAFDAADGRELLRVPRNDDPTWCTPSVHSGKDVTQLICNGYKRIAGYNLATGDELWHLQGGGDVPVPRPIVAGDLFVLTAGHGKSPIYGVKADARGDLTPTDDAKPAGLAWWHKVHGSYMPTPIVVADLVFVANDNGILTALELATGAKVFRERLPGSAASTYSASPVAADGRIYVTSESGQVDVIRAAREFEVLASNQMGETCMASPAISDGLLLIRGKSNLYALGTEQ